MKNIISAYKLNTQPIPLNKMLNVVSVNNTEVLKEIQKSEPDVVLVHGTRVISKELLEKWPGIFLNIHVGITPQYRGVHGMYWALSKKDNMNSGVTLHYVNEGIDKGDIIEQKILQPLTEDNFTTYPLLQLAEGLLILDNALEFGAKNEKQITHKGGSGNLWYHPTIWYYLYHRIWNGVK